MLFHDWTFLVFFAAFYPLWWAVRNSPLRSGVLVVASYVFYAAWSPLYLPIILAATLVDWLAVRRMARSGRRRRWIAVAVAVDLSLLAAFKYAGFLARNLNWLLGLAGVPVTVPEPDLLPPVGVSFFIFQSMSYAIDCYRGEIEEEPSFVRYAAFVALFPQLVAGPVERARTLLPQLRQRIEIRGKDISDGLSLFVTGLFKKVALADWIAVRVDEVYAWPGGHSGSALLLATLGFGWQIYFDFSGYTDMARGVARTMGLRLTINFRHPYLATGLGDFWRRWHISLSSWFRDYVFIPLGGSRRGPSRTRTAILATMLISGLWHGASWTFVVWGGLHGVAYVLTRGIERRAPRPRGVRRLARGAAVYLFVSFAWIFFRAESFEDAIRVVARIVTAGLEDPAFSPLLAAAIGLVWIYQAVCESRWRGRLREGPVAVILVVLMLVWITLCVGSGSRPFIYFQF